MAAAGKVDPNVPMADVAGTVKGPEEEATGDSSATGARRRARGYIELL
jgi:hypothetical protein